MKLIKYLAVVRHAVQSAIMVVALAGSTLPLHAGAQAPAAPAPAAARQMGTVKAISGTNITIATDAGAQYAVTVAEAARIVQLAPGSTDLKAAQAIALTDIGVGDRVLVTGKAGDDPGSFNATRVILMKSGDIAQKHAGEQPIGRSAAWVAL